MRFPVPAPSLRNEPTGRFPHHARGLLFPSSRSPVNFGDDENMSPERSQPTAIQVCGYLPGAIGRIVELHGIYYNQQWALDMRFEAQVASELSAFLLGFDATRDGFWTAARNAEIVGGIAIDGRRGSAPDDPTIDNPPKEQKEKIARLRWFILAPECQGQGIGSLLMREAIDFCREAEFRSVYLWTFAGLDAARRLYEKFGFQLQHEYESDVWGRTVTHQRYVLEL